MVVFRLLVFVLLGYVKNHIIIIRVAKTPNTKVFSNVFIHISFLPRRQD